MPASFDFTQEPDELLGDFGLRVAEKYDTYPAKRFQRLHIDKLHHELTFSRPGASDKLTISIELIHDALDLSRFVNGVASVAFGATSWLEQEINRYNQFLTIDNSTGTPEVVASY